MSTAAQAERARDDQGVFSTRTWRVVDLATKHALIDGGLGWGHLPEHVAREILRAGRLVELRLDAWGGVAPRRSLVLVWRSGAVLGPVAQWAQKRLARAVPGRGRARGGDAITRRDGPHHPRRSFATLAGRITFRR